MRNSIIVSISDLRSLVQDVRRTGKKYVELSVFDPSEDGDSGEPEPAELSLSAFSPDEPDICIDFEPVFAPDNESELSDSILTATHISSNLL